MVGVAATGVVAGSAGRAGRARVEMMAKVGEMAKVVAAMVIALAVMGTEAVDTARELKAEKATVEVATAGPEGEMASWGEAGRYSNSRRGARWQSRPWSTPRPLRNYGMYRSC